MEPIVSGLAVLERLHRKKNSLSKFEKHVNVILLDFCIPRFLLACM